MPDLTRDPFTISLDDVPALLEAAFFEGCNRRYRMAPFLYPLVAPDHSNKGLFERSATSVVIARIQKESSK